MVALTHWFVSEFCGVSHIPTFEFFSCVVPPTLEVFRWLWSVYQHVCAATNIARAYSSSWSVSHSKMASYLFILALYDDLKAQRVHFWAFQMYAYKCQMCWTRLCSVKSSPIVTRCQLEQNDDWGLHTMIMACVRLNAIDESFWLDMAIPGEHHSRFACCSNHQVSESR